MQPVVYSDMLACTRVKKGHLKFLFTRNVFGEKRITVLCSRTAAVQVDVKFLFFALSFQHDGSCKEDTNWTNTQDATAQHTQSRAAVFVQETSVSADCFETMNK